MNEESGTYPWSLMTQIFHSGQPSHGGDCKINYLKQQSAGRHVAPLGHIILVLSQPVFLRNAACLAEKQQIPIL